MSCRSMIGRVVLTSVGCTHASSVKAPETAASVSDIGTCTLASDAPSSDTPFAKYPDPRVTGPISIPVLPFPDASAVAVPLLSLNPYAATGAVGADAVMNIHVTSVGSAAPDLSRTPTWPPITLAV